MSKEEKFLISKSNPLLNMKNDFNLYQQRMLNLYLAKINPLDESSRTVSVTLKQFIDLIGIKEVSVKKMRTLAKKALDLKVDLYAVETDEDGKKHESMKMDYVSVWERFKVDVNKDGEWYVELVASSAIMPYMFQIKDLGYLKYSILCALRMRSPIAEKLYEQCYRFKDKGAFSITPLQLRTRLGIADKKSYESYNQLKTNVLLRCIKEINEDTDIYVQIVSEKRARRRGSPVTSVTFSVKDNPKYKRSEADKKLEALYEEESSKQIVDGIATEMKPFEVEADGQITLAAYELQQEFGLSEKEAETILHDKEKLHLSDERVREVIRYVLPRKTKKARIAYIRHMLEDKDADLTMMTAEEKRDARNQFNQFEQNKYDFDELEKEIVMNEPADASEIDAKEEKQKNLEPHHLPPYYVVMGDPRAADRLAAYATLGISGDNIKILTPEEHARLSGQE